MKRQVTANVRVSCEMVRFEPSASQARDKYDGVAAAIRGQIVANRLPPGTQLPRREELLTQFQVSSATLQRAINSLVEDGFLEARQRGGTRVVAHPPHLSRYGVVLPSDPRHPALWNRFWQAMLWATLAFPHTPQRTLVPLYVDADGAPSAGLDEAEREVLAHRLAGLVFTNHPGKLAHSPLMSQPGLPRVAFMSNGNYLNTVAKVWVDYPSLFVRAAAWLAQHGRRQVAVIGALRQVQQAALRQTLADHGLHTPPKWQLQAPRVPDPAQIRAVAQLFAPGAATRPDALLVLDDNLLDDACGAVLACGWRIPADVTVVSHWNFPNPLPRFVPIHFLGFDARQLLATCLARLEAARQGGAVAAFTTLPAIAADEAAALVPV